MKALIFDAAKKTEENEPGMVGPFAPTNSASEWIFFNIILAEISFFRAIQC